MHVTIYNAITVDGRNAPPGYQFDLGAFYTNASEFKEDVTLVGADTLLKDQVLDETLGDPPIGHQLDDPPVDQTLEEDTNKPLLVVIDTQGRVKSWNQLLKSGYWRDVFCIISARTPSKVKEYLRKWRVDFAVIGTEKADLRATLKYIETVLEADSVRVDSGGTLNGLLLEQKLVTEVSTLVFPAIASGEERTMCRGVPHTTKLKLKAAKVQGECVWLRYDVVK